MSSVVINLVVMIVVSDCCSLTPRITFLNLCPKSTQYSEGTSPALFTWSICQQRYKFLSNYCFLFYLSKMFKSIGIRTLLLDFSLLKKLTVAKILIEKSGNICVFLVYRVFFCIRGFT